MVHSDGGGSFPWRGAGGVLIGCGPLSVAAPRGLIAVLNVKILPQRGDSKSAFVDFADVRDAVEAYRTRETLLGATLRLDFNQRRARPDTRPPPPASYDRGGYDRRDGRERDYYPPSDYRPGYDRGGGYNRDYRDDYDPRDYYPPRRDDGYGRGGYPPRPYDGRRGYPDDRRGPYPYPDERGAPPYDDRGPDPYEYGRYDRRGPPPAHMQGPGDYDRYDRDYPRGAYGGNGAPPRDAPRDVPPPEDKGRPPPPMPDERYDYQRDRGGFERPRQAEGPERFPADRDRGYDPY